MVDQGYFYIAFGEKYIHEATVSAKSLRACSPEATICVMTSGDDIDPVFDLVLNNQYCNKIEGLLKTPFNRTFFVDTDTYFCGSCDKGFYLLDHWDVCMAEAPNEVDLSLDGTVVEGCRPLNSGVIIYDTGSFSMFQSASDAYKKDELESPSLVRRRDQSYISESIMKSNLRIHVIPSTWNFRSCFFSVLKGPVKIIHDRGKNMKLIESRVNSRTGHRCWNPHTQMLVSDPNHLTIHL